MIDNIQSFMQACHPFGYPLLACSVLLLSAILYHALFVGRHWCRFLKTMPTSAEELAVYTPEKPCELSNLVLQLQSATLSAPETEKNTEAALRRIIDSGRGGLAIISMIINIAPMLGILGTAWGLVDIFGVFGSPDAQSGIALGISKALYTTIFGLAIAVPGIMAHIWFERRLERRAARINEAFTRLLTSHRA